jgi:hypothetical protein
MLKENNLTRKRFEIKDITWLKKKDRPLGRLALIGI